MTKLFKKIERVAKAIEADGMHLTFVGLLHRVDAPDRWDLVILTPDLEPQSKASLQYVYDRLMPALSKDEMVSIARVVVLSPDDRTINDLLDSGQLALQRVVRL